MGHINKCIQLPEDSPRVWLKPSYEAITILAISGRWLAPGYDVLRKAEAQNFSVFAAGIRLTLKNKGPVKEQVIFNLSKNAC